jgi:recombination DNA repair RAD52 pathway protein
VFRGIKLLPPPPYWIILSLDRQVPTFAMALKRASSKAAASIDEAAKTALLTEKKGKALVDNTLQEAFEDDAVYNKRQRQDNTTPNGTVRTCSSEGAPRAPPPGFATSEGEDTIEDCEIIGILPED